MRSPIFLLEKQIAGAPFNVAPEKGAQCANLRDAHKINLALVDETGFGIRIGPDTEAEGHEILLPVAAIEYLWAFCHFCWVLTQEYGLAQRAGQIQFDCHGNTRLRGSRSLLTWAMSNMSTTGRDSWPDDLPKPRQSTDDSRVATELFLCALAWILHHEIAHAVLQHPFLTMSNSQQEERDADKHATGWLLDGLDTSDFRYKKRSMGIAAAVLCLQSLEDAAPSCLSNTHPAARDRIFANIAPGSELIEGTCAIVLQYLTKDRGVTANLDADSFGEILGDLLIGISRPPNGS